MAKPCELPRFSAGALEKHERYQDRLAGGLGFGASKEKRSEFARMFEDARKWRFDIVLCWALDRFSREGMMPTIGYLQRLAAAGVGFHSYTEPKLSTDNEMIRDIVLAVMASLAKQERLRHVERIHAGIARARIKGTQSGKPIGRPWIDKRKEAAIRAELAASGKPRGCAKSRPVPCNASRRRLRLDGTRRRDWRTVG